MPFDTDKEFASDVVEGFGEYLSTFTSEHGQVTAALFKQGDGLVAHVTIANRLEVWEVTDKWASDLHRFAAERGFRDKLKIVYH